ncbi:hypothetical protein SP18gp013 [Shigella phage SP18]|uniref:Uncharacterized protein n=1 Tax=Shigella phage SP18 TaxID=645664 RepID=E3SFA2_BPSP8|nr:hypothetical protein SP18_gp013 [Shigella phage SP18]ADO19355.1 hypothetical protein SP18gp013 [Shigella phage SP18]
MERDIIISSTTDEDNKMITSFEIGQQYEMSALQAAEAGLTKAFECAFANIRGKIFTVNKIAVYDKETDMNKGIYLNVSNTKGRREIMVVQPNQLAMFNKVA